MMIPTFKISTAKDVDYFVSKSWRRKLGRNDNATASWTKEVGGESMAEETISTDRAPANRWHGGCENERDTVGQREE
jgi:hypothetical protein